MSVIIVEKFNKVILQFVIFKYFAKFRNTINSDCTRCYFRSLNERLRVHQFIHGWTSVTWRKCSMVIAWFKWEVALAVLEAAGSGYSLGTYWVYTFWRLVINWSRKDLSLSMFTVLTRDFTKFRSGPRWSEMWYVFLWMSDCELVHKYNVVFFIHQCACLHLPM